LTVESQEDLEWAWVTPQRLRVLALLADERTEQEIADELGVAYSTVRSHVEELKRHTGQGSVKEIRRYWRKAGPRYVVYVARLAGVGERWYPR
jgi:DNA-binding CsgD family transcriptional regulator